MRAVIVLGLLATLAFGVPLSGATSLPATHSHAGLTIRLPMGWHVVHERLTACTNPIERLTLSGHGALVTLTETLDPRLYVRRFSPRPRRFALHGEPRWIACCAPRDRRGWLFAFRDHGRGFYVYVYLGRPGTRREALRALDSLRVRARTR